MANVDGVRVRGRVRIPAAAAPFTGALVLVRLEDVSLADAASTLVAEQVIRDVSHATGRETSVPFDLRTAAALDPRAHYSVRAHVDLTQTGRVKVGDLVSTQSYPVHADRLPADLDVFVVTVR